MNCVGIIYECKISGRSWQIHDEKTIRPFPFAFSSTSLSARTVHIGARRKAVNGLFFTDRPACGASINNYIRFLGNSLVARPCRVSVVPFVCSLSAFVSRESLFCSLLFLRAEIYCPPLFSRCASMIYIKDRESPPLPLLSRSPPAPFPIIFADVLLFCPVSRIISAVYMSRHRADSWCRARMRIHYRMGVWSNMFSAINESRQSAGLLRMLAVNLARRWISYDRADQSILEQANNWFLLQQSFSNDPRVILSEPILCEVACSSHIFVTRSLLAIRWFSPFSFRCADFTG